MKRNISPVLLIGIAVLLLILHVAAIFYCDHEHRVLAAAVARAAAQQEAERQAALNAEEGDEKIPDRMRLKGADDGPVYWAEFYGDTTKSLKYLLSITIPFLLFSIWFARPGKTG